MPRGENKEREGLFGDGGRGVIEPEAERVPLGSKARAPDRGPMG